MSSVRSSSSTLCCAMLSTAASREALSPMRIRVPADSISSSGSELSDGGDSPVATTPEAFTDSENDSSFESEYDDEATTRCSSSSNGMLMMGKGKAICSSSSSSNNSKRWPECTADIDSSHERHRPQQQLEAPRPLRKVRFTLGGRESASTAATTAAAPSCWGKEQRAVIQENALRSLGMLRPAESSALLAQRRRWQRRQKSSSRSSGSATGAASKNRALAPAPFKSTSANTSSTAVAHKTTTSPFSSIPTPASPKKKRKVSTWSSPSSHRVHVRTSGTGGGGGGGGGDSHRRPSRPSSSSRGKVAVAMAVAAAQHERVTPTTTTTTTTSELAAAAAVSPAKEASSSSSGFVPCATATAADSVTVPRPVAPMDLSCTEDVDIDAAMMPGGEVRTPICRFLVPCWPEGVEGYEEAGGWRRLGGCHTKGNFPEGRRCI
ncbi:unnamed protein product [Ectocarpus fasciculatus]